MASKTIAAGEVAELRYLADGLMVRSRSRRQTFLVSPELEGFADLVRRIEEWAPVSVPRKRSSWSSGQRALLLISANLGLIIAGFQDNPKIGIPASIAEATILIFCAIWAWRSKFISRRLKWLMLAVLLPVISLLSHAYELWSQHT